MKHYKTRLAHLIVFGTLVHGFALAVHTMLIGPMFTMPDAIAEVLFIILVGPALIVIWPFRDLFFQWGLVGGEWSYPSPLGFILAYVIFIAVVLLTDLVYMQFRPKTGKKKRKT